MIVLFKNESGTYSVRPAYIGFIKNDLIRRTLCTLCYPLVVCITILLNLVKTALVCVVLTVRSIWYPLSRMTPIWKAEIWKRPRTAEDANRKLD